MQLYLEHLFLSHTSGLPDKVHYATGQGCVSADASNTAHATVLISLVPTADHGGRFSRPLLQTLVFLNDGVVVGSGERPHPRCASTAALRKVHWARVGLALEDSMMLAPTASRVGGVWIGLHFRSNEARAGDLTKGWFEASKSGIKAIGRAIDAAIDGAECALAQQGVPLSKMHRDCMEAHEYASHTAHALANVVYNAVEPGYTREMFLSMGASEHDNLEAVVREELERDWSSLFSAGADGSKGSLSRQAKATGYETIESMSSAKEDSAFEGEVEEREEEENAYQLDETSEDDEDEALFDADTW